MGINDIKLVFLKWFKSNDLTLVYKTNIFVKLLKQGMLTFINLLFHLILFIFSLIVFISRRKHLLVTLISLEFIVLVLYLFIYNFLCLVRYEYYFSIVFLTFRVCEGALGLSILVSLIRTHGTDYFQSYNILQC